MNNEQLQSTKDQAAKELGYKNFGDVIMEEGELNTVINRAMDICVERVNRESLKLLERASNLVGSPLTGVSGSTDLACDRWQNDYKQFKTTKS